MCPSRRFQKSSKPAAHAVSAIRARDYVYTKLMSVARTAYPRRLHRCLFLLALRALDAAARLCAQLLQRAERCAHRTEAQGERSVRSTAFRRQLIWRRRTGERGLLWRARPQRQRAGTPGRAEDTGRLLEAEAAHVVVTVLAVHRDETHAGSEFRMMLQATRQW